MTSSANSVTQELLLTSSEDLQKKASALGESQAKVVLESTAEKLVFLEKTLKRILGIRVLRASSEHELSKVASASLAVYSLLEEAVNAEKAEERLNLALVADESSKLLFCSLASLLANLAQNECIEDCEKTRDVILEQSSALFKLLLDSSSCLSKAGFELENKSKLLGNLGLS